LAQDHPTAIRYPKTAALTLERQPKAITLGQSETLRCGNDGTIVAYGAMLEQALEAADLLADELDLTVINARFVKPLDQAMVSQTLTSGRFVVTVEEGCAMGGFGSAFLEEASSQGLDTRCLRRLALPDRFIEHGERTELLDACGLSPAGIADTCREMAQRESMPAAHS
jgi:1-deoxy-D-xylulose-5-phosphate synthase